MRDPIWINPLQLCLHYKWIEPNQIRSRSISIHFVIHFVKVAKVIINMQLCVRRL